MADSGPTDPTPTLDPALLDKLRRGVPLRMNPMGKLLFADEPITHPRVREALFQGLDLSDTGEPIVRLGWQWCYLTIADTPLRATAIMRDGAGNLSMRLDDGRTVPLDLCTLWDEPDRGLRCMAPSVTSGRPLAVRLNNRAQMDLAAWIEPQDDGQMVLILDNQRWPIATQAPPPSA